LLSLHAQPAPWLRLVNRGQPGCVEPVSIVYTTPFLSQFRRDL